MDRRRVRSSGESRRCCFVVNLRILSSWPCFINEGIDARARFSFEAMRLFGLFMFIEAMEELLEKPLEELTERLSID